MQSLAYWVWSTIIRLFLHCWCMITLSVSIYNLPGDASIGATWYMYWFIGLGLQSSMGCVYFCTAGAFIDLSVLVYNHPRDASVSALLVHLLVYRFWSTILQGMCLLVQCWCMYWSIGPGLQSSMGCASINLSVSIYNQPRVASTTALSVHVSVYQSWSTIILVMRLFLHC